MVKEKTGPIKIKIRLPTHFLQNAVFKGIFVQFAHDVPRVVDILGRRPECPMGSVNLNGNSVR